MAYVLDSINTKQNHHQTLNQFYTKDNNITKRVPDKNISHFKGDELELKHREISRIY